MRREPKEKGPTNASGREVKWKPAMFTLCWWRNAGGRGKKRPRKPDILDFYPSLPVLLNHWEGPTLQIGVDSSFQNCQVHWIQSQLRPPVLTDNQCLWYKFGNYDFQYHRGVTDNHCLPRVLSLTFHIYFFQSSAIHSITFVMAFGPFGTLQSKLVRLYSSNPWLWKKFNIGRRCMSTYFGSYWSGTA